MNLRHLIAVIQIEFERYTGTLTVLRKIKIEFSDSELKNIKFSGRLKRYDDLEPLFDRLEYTRDVKFVVEKDHITIQGK